MFYATFITGNSLYDRLSKELARSVEDGDDDITRRVRCASGQVHLIQKLLTWSPPSRIISVGDATSIVFSGDEGFQAVWKSLDAGEETACAFKGTKYPAVSKPGAAIIDVSKSGDTHLLMQLRLTIPSFMTSSSPWMW